MAPLGRSIVRDRRTIEYEALNFAKKMARSISDLHELEWDVPNLDEDDFLDFTLNDGQRMWEHFLTYGPMLENYVKYSPIFWVMTEENFANRVYTMIEETGYHTGNFEKEDLLCICAQILIIANWFIENNTEIMMDTVIDVVYRITLRMLNSPSI
ncbi:hypothetical protein TNIN_437181 [Trichonephila inaurata madagascariensis]|uniref:Uncharacterized protein n=1 Tax=Trichonephila inaurata madagascariensis TaxID=2747483 RepID=A0A8X6X8X4_9ARAC|nr:hypothetical protein TNIN_437181 [Trichonephila inaurata madagascariensis]